MKVPTLCKAFIVALATINLGVRTASAQILPPSMHPLREYGDTLLEGILKRARESAIELQRSADHAKSEAEIIRSGVIAQARERLDQRVRDAESSQTTLLLSIASDSSALAEILKKVDDERSNLIRVDSLFRHTLNDSTCLSPVIEGLDDPQSATRAALRDHLRNLREDLETSRHDLARLDSAQQYREQRITSAKERIEQLRSDVQEMGTVTRLLNANNFSAAVERLTAAARADSASASNEFARIEAAMKDSAAIEHLTARGWLPLHTQHEAELFFGQDIAAGLRSATVGLGALGSGSVTTELGSLVLSPIRLSAIAIVARANGVEDSTTNPPVQQKETRNEASASSVARFFAGGGSVVASLTAPIFFDRRVGGRITTVGQLTGRFAFDFPATSVNIDNVELSDFPNSLNLGVEVYFGYNIPEIVNAFVFFDWSYSNPNELYANQLGLAAESGFGYYQLLGGFEVKQYLRVLVSQAGGPGDLDRGMRLTVQFMRYGEHIEHEPSTS